jgi:peptidylprolyl isomerase
MKEGGKARLIIPPDLAFGAEGAGGIIPPDATITMDVELLTAVAPPTAPEVDEGDLTTTDSGLQYYDIVEGEGEMPVQGQEVVVNYAAWLQDGGQYVASSDTVGEPLTFALGDELAVFTGWNEGVATMKKGGTRFLVIPPELALGEAGGGRIPPNATLLMEIELVDILPLVLPTEVSEADFTTTDSGLKYYDLVVGDGATAETGSTVTVNYTGWLTNNVKFDSSLDTGVPFPFTLGTGAVIPGWDEGVAGMKVGGKRQLIIPAELGYGETGSGAIPPGATLIFEVELLDVTDSPSE